MILVGKPENKRPLVRPKCRWEDNIKMDSREVRLGVMGRNHLIQKMEKWRALVNMITNLRVP
jgi:hypothetical protein